MKIYHDLIRNLLIDEKTQIRPSRSGVYAISKFGNHFEYDLSEGFPLITTRKINFSLVSTELLWFLNGGTNIKYLNQNGVHIWDKWADKNGNLGRVYGAQWCSWRTADGRTINQIKNVLKSIKEEPYSKRHIVTAWNPGELDEMALPPCHVLFQFYVNTDGTLDCHLYQRAADVAIGLVYNIASYSLLTHLIARETDLKPGRFIHSIGDLHIYCGKGKRGKFYIDFLDELRIEMKKNNPDYGGLISKIQDIAPNEAFEEELGRDGNYDHIPGLLQILSRKPYSLPKLRIESNNSLFQITPKDIYIGGYRHHPSIKFDVAV